MNSPFTALWPLHPVYSTVGAILTSCTSVWKENWQHSAPAPAFSLERELVNDSVSDWVSESAPPSLTEPQWRQLQLLSITKTPNMMVRYSWWRGSLGVIFMASYFTHGIFDPLSCTGTLWIVDKVMLEHSLHSVLICDIPTVIFQLDCSRAAVCPCTVFRVRCRPHSEG